MYCAHSLIENPGFKALTMDNAQFAMDVILSNGFKARGEVTCAGASINGLLYCNNCSLDNAGGTALAADGAMIGNDALLGNWFYAKGAVGFRGRRNPREISAVSGGHSTTLRGLHWFSTAPG